MGLEPRSRSTAPRTQSTPKLRSIRSVSSYLLKGMVILSGPIGSGAASTIENLTFGRPARASCTWSAIMACVQPVHRSVLAVACEHHGRRPAGSSAFHLDELRPEYATSSDHLQHRPEQPVRTSLDNHHRAPGRGRYNAKIGRQGGRMDLIFIERLLDGRLRGVSRYGLHDLTDAFCWPQRITPVESGCSFYNTERTAIRRLVRSSNAGGSLRTTGVSLWILDGSCLTAYPHPDRPTVNNRMFINRILGA